jgi:hypothetical protein
VTKEWYFQEGHKHVGPIAAAALKKLAESGRITSETLVWRNGTPEWVKAGTVRGLIERSLPSPAPPPLVSPAGEDTDPATIYDVWHPIDALVAAARRSTTPTFAASLSRTAGFAGLYTSVTAAFVVLFGGSVFAIHDKDVSGMWFIVASACAIIIAQYRSQKIFSASEKLIRSNQSTLSSNAIPDCLIIVTAIVSIAGFIGLLWLCGTSRNFSYGLGGVLVLCSGLFVCLAAIHPAELAVVIKPDCTTSEEAIGILCFTAKLLLRISPVLVLAAVAVGTAEMVSLLINFLRTDFKGNEFLAVNFGFNFGFLSTAVMINLFALPFYIYLALLFNYLSFDVLASILAIPAQLKDIVRARDSDVHPDRQ